MIETNIRLHALRRLLFFSVAEAAEIVGNVTPRCWAYWEEGKRSIPRGVMETIEALCVWRERTIADIRRRQGATADYKVVWYPTRDAWRSSGQPLLYWRPYCSAVAAVAAADRRVRLVIQSAGRGSHA